MSRDGTAVAVRPDGDGVEDELERRTRVLSLEQKVRLLTGADFWALHAEPAVGLRRVVTSDGPAGVRGEYWDERDTSANVPSPTALAATWDEALVHRIGRLLAAEARRKGVDVLLAPTVNLHRTPYGGRHFECFSEDPLLSARIGVAYVRGVQDGGVAATVKHFVANDSETDRFTVDVRVTERALRELYLAPFEAIVREAGVWAVMAAYNRVNGTTMSEHPMLADVLKGEWGFDGVVMSDWFATRSTEATGNAALDLAMPGPGGPWGDALLEAVRAGRVEEAAVDDKVRRLLRLAARVGALDGIAAAAPAPAALDIDVAAELRGAASASFVLARNDGDLLPLDRGALRRVAVIGPNAATARTLGGGSATVFPPYTVSPLDGLRDALGHDVAIDHAVGARARTRLPIASPDLVTDPSTGAPGLLVRLLDADGAVLAEEHRTTGQFTWMAGNYGPAVPRGAVRAIEVIARLRAPADGSHAVGCSGLGAFRLTADGAVLIDETLAPPPGVDAVETVLSPPDRQAALALAAGDEVELVLRHDPERDASPTMFQLRIDPPAATPDEELDEAVTLAAGADAAVVVVGTTEEVESEGFDRDSLALPGRQDELVRRVAAANPRTVVVVNAGAPVLMPWLAEVPAVLLAWFPGQEFGHALADVLLGSAEPGGRLPTTWPAREGGPLLSPVPEDGTLAYDEGLAIGHRGPAAAGALLPFGHGLGYTAWAYEDLDVPAEASADDDVVVRVRLRNAGQRAGREVVQVYASRDDGTWQTAARRLAGFAVAHVEAGEERDVEVTVSPRALAHWDDERRTMTVAPGRVRLAAGRSWQDARLERDLTVRHEPS